jgi:hypothetical protein
LFSLRFLPREKDFRFSKKGGKEAEEIKGKKGRKLVARD